MTLQRLGPVRGAALGNARMNGSFPQFWRKYPAVVTLDISDGGSMNDYERSCAAWCLEHSDTLRKRYITVQFTGADIEKKYGKPATTTRVVPDSETRKLKKEGWL